MLIFETSLVCAESSRRATGLFKRQISRRAGVLSRVLGIQVKQSASTTTRLRRDVVRVGILKKAGKLAEPVCALMVTQGSALRLDVTVGLSVACHD